MSSVGKKSIILGFALAAGSCALLRVNRAAPPPLADVECVSANADGPTYSDKAQIFSVSKGGMVFAMDANNMVSHPLSTICTLYLGKNPAAGPVASAKPVPRVTGDARMPRAQCFGDGRTLYDGKIRKITFNRVLTVTPPAGAPYELAGVSSCRIDIPSGPMDFYMYRMTH